MVEWAKSFGFSLACLAAAFGLSISPAAAQSSPPTLQIGDAPAILPGDAWTYFAGLGLTSPTRPSDALIERTATALGDDPTRIYAFVRNEIEVVPMFGVQKGARGCLIDKACTPFDQAHLLAELLRAADAHSPSISLGTAYEFVDVTLTLAQMTDWLGIANQAALNEVLADGGIPFSSSGSDYTLLHLVVRITIDGQPYRLDPSFKSHTTRAGIANLDAVMGFSPSTFMSSGGGGALSGASSSAPNGATTVQPVPQVAAFNRNNVRSSLQGYSVNLLNDIRANHGDDEIEDVVGGRDIVAFQGTLPTTPGYTLGTVRATFNNDVPVALRTQTTISVTGVATPYNWTLDEIYGEELAIIPEQILPAQGPPSNPPDPVQFRFYGNGQVMTGWLVGASASMSVAFNHPYAANAGAYLDRTLTGFAHDFFAGGTQFVIGAGRMTPDFGAYIESRSSAEEGWVSVQPQFGPIPGEPPDPVVTGGQHATKRRYAVSFATQFSSAIDMAGELGDATIVVHDMLVTARTISFIGGNSITAVTSIGGLSAQGAISANSSTADTSQTQAARRAAAALFGALEGSAIEQNLDSVNPISTATRFDWFSANASTDRFYWANSSNKADVESQILADGYYNNADSWVLAEAYVDAGYTVIVPRSSSLGPGLHGITVCGPNGAVSGGECGFPGPERGTAIIAISPTGVAHVVTASAEGLKGGAGTNDAETNPARVFSIPEDFLEQQFTSRAEAYNVDMATGNVTYTPPPDIVVGEGEYPYSLSFQRSYRSGTPYQRDLPPNQLSPWGAIWQERFVDSGWTSNWMAEARVENDGQRAFGDQSPREATDTIVATRVLLALSADQGSDLATLQYQLGAIHSLAWWSEQLSNNAIQIVHGADNRSYFKLADGTYLGQPGDPTQIEVFGNRYSPGPSGKYEPARWFYNRMCVRATNRDGSTSFYGTWNGSFTACDMSAAPHGTLRGVRWMRFRRQAFREGVIVSFDDTTMSNNLGRSISLLGGGGAFTVRDDTVQSRTAAIALTLTGPGTMSVTGTEGETWVYNGSTAANWRVFAPSSTTNPIVTFDFNEVFGQVEQLTDAVGNDAQYYISTGRISAMVDPAGFASRTYFDEHSQPVRVTNRLGFDTLTDYDSFRRVESVMYPEGNREEYGYDSRHNRTLTRRVPKPGSGLSPTETEATYDTLCNMPLTQTDARENVTTYVLVPNRCLISTMSQPAVDDGTTSSSALVNPVTTSAWNAFGQLLTRVDPSGRERRNAYNASTNYLQSVTVENGGADIVTAFGRNAQGDINSVTDPRGNVHTGTYDTSRRLTRYDGPAGTNVASEWHYNEDGLVDFARQATGQAAPNDWAVTSYTYWVTGRVKTMTDPDGGVTQYFYDALNRLDHMLDPVNRRTESEYDAEGQVLQERRGVGLADEIVYATRTWTANGQLDWVEDANHNRSELVYDGFDRLCRLFFPSPTTVNVANAPAGPLSCATATNPATHDYEEYGYDANDNRTSLRLRSHDGSNSHTIPYTYDALNREIFKDIPGGTSADVTSRYDPAGRRTFARFSTTLTPSADCTANNPGVDYCYDAVGRLSAETIYGRRLSFQYDAASNRTVLSYPGGGLWVQYTYDTLNRVDQIGESGVLSGPQLLADYSYDAQSRRDLLARAGGAGALTDHSFSPASRLTLLNHNLSGTANDANWVYTYTDAGQVETRSVVQAYEWAVEALDEDYQRNGLNQYTSVEGVAFTHDRRGNLVSDGARGFCYDLENRLTRVAAAGADPCTGAATLELAYDPLGRLRQTTAGTTVTQFVYDGDRLVAEYDGSANVLRRYVHGPGVDEPIVWYEGPTLANRRWLVTDRQGSVVAAADALGNLVGAPYRYGPYGEPEDDNWTGSRFRYTGQIALPEAGLYHYKARVYDPSLGRFLQTDPVGYEDDLNIYLYVGNDPMNFADPSGRQRERRIRSERIPRQPVRNNVNDALRDGARLSVQIINDRIANSNTPGNSANFEVYTAIKDSVGEDGGTQYQVVMAFVTERGASGDTGPQPLSTASGDPFAGSTHNHNSSGASGRGLHDQSRLNRGPQLNDPSNAERAHELRVAAGKPDPTFHMGIIGPDGALRDFPNGRGQGIEIDPPGTYRIP